MPTRLNHYLSQAGVSSRRAADVLIQKGHVKVNGVIVTEMGTKIDPNTDKVEFLFEQSKKWQEISKPSHLITYVLYKPKGYVTSMKQQGADPIVAQLLPKEPRVFPVGRLDKDSEGMLICTNDGDLTARLTHPSTHIEKEYVVHCTLQKNITENMVKSFLGRVAKGVKLDGRRTLTSKIDFVRFLRPGMVEIRVVLREGRNRQIRRMMGTINLEVVKLVRVRVGRLSLDDMELAHGKWRILSDEEVGRLESA